MAFVSCEGCNKPLTNDDALLGSCVNCGYVFTPEQRKNHREVVAENLKVRVSSKKSRTVLVGLLMGINLVVCLVILVLMDAEDWQGWLQVIEFIILSFVYFLPSFVAAMRIHHNTLAITVLNLLLGWTFIGWVVALVWAFTNPPHAPQTDTKE